MAGSINLKVPPPYWQGLIPPLNLKKPNRILVPKSLPVLSYLPQMAKQAPKKLAVN